MAMRVPSGPGRERCQRATPLGLKIAPSRFVDPGDLRLTLRVNGALKQNAHTGDNDLVRRRPDLDVSRRRIGRSGVGFNQFEKDIPRRGRINEGDP